MTEHEKMLGLVLYNPETGLFTRRTRVRVGANGAAGSTNAKGYVKIFVAGRMYAAHRLAYFYMTGNWPEQIDHINGKRSDNRWTNLRACTADQNRLNLKKYTNNTTSVTGVYWYKRQCRWTASIDCRGRREELGYFDSKEQALAARRAAEARLFGEFARVA